MPLCLLISNPFLIMPTSLNDIVDIEEALTKTGPELFKELYRIYPVADPEDYFKGGQWRNEVMKTDIILLESHRRECGAPDVDDLDDIKLPAHMPSTGPSLATTGFMGNVGQNMALKPAGAAVGPTFQPGALVGAATAGSAPVVEIRLIALFVAKWKLDPVASKTALAKLTPTRRRYVIQNFKTTTTGMEATKELETYIAECEASGDWDAATNGGTGNGAAGATVTPPAKAAMVVRPAVPTLVAPAVTGLKRPVGLLAGGVVAAGGPAKRPGMGFGIGGAAPTLIRPAAPATVRPPGKGGGKLISGLLSGF